jgi:hypothetical protein
MALWTVTRNFPEPGGVSCFVSHFTRNWPVSLMNESLWESPRPDHEPSRTHPTIGFAWGWAIGPHALVIKTAAIRMDFI